MSVLLFMYLPLFFCIGASKVSPSQFETGSAPLFLSSLDCTDDDHSLLNDCIHDRLGQATCDDNSGLAVAKCYGNECPLSMDFIGA